MGNAAKLGCSERNSAGTGVGTSAGMRGNVDKPEREKGKVVDITMSDKINKTPILVSY